MQSTNFNQQSWLIRSMTTLKAIEFEQLVRSFPAYPNQGFLSKSRWVALLASLLLAGMPTALPQNAAPEFDKFSSAHDHLFPSEMDVWQNRPQYVVDGLRKADSLRRSLLSTDATSKSGWSELPRSWLRSSPFRDRT